MSNLDEVSDTFHAGDELVTGMIFLKKADIKKSTFVFIALK